MNKKATVHNVLEMISAAKKLREMKKALYCQGVFIEDITPFWLKFYTLADFL